MYLCPLWRSSRGKLIQIDLFCLFFSQSVGPDAGWKCEVRHWCVQPVASSSGERPPASVQRSELLTLLSPPQTGQSQPSGQSMGMLCCVEVAGGCRDWAGQGRAVLAGQTPQQEQYRTSVIATPSQGGRSQSARPRRWEELMLCCSERCERWEMLWGLWGDVWCLMCVVAGPWPSLADVMWSHSAMLWPATATSLLVTGETVNTFRLSQSSSPASSCRTSGSPSVPRRSLINQSWGRDWRRRSIRWPRSTRQRSKPLIFDILTALSSPVFQAVFKQILQALAGRSL